MHPTIAGAELVVNDVAQGFRIFRLAQPMRPGEQRVMTVETRLHLRDIQSQPAFTRIVDNGTFLTFVQLLPNIGQVAPGMLQNAAMRRRFGMPQLEGDAHPEDSAATAHTTHDRGWAKYDITDSTAAGQVPLASGNRVFDETHGGRRAARFVSGAPVHPRFSIQSARFVEKRRQHKGKGLAVYVHPAHPFNVDRMLNAMAVSLDYLQQQFGP